MSKTMDDLKAAFAGESQANRKYLAFAKKADQEGFAQVAKLFRAAAEAETIHAHAHLQNMGGVKSTLENLTEAVAGETYEAKEMYPPMLAEAEAAKHVAARMFKFAMLAESVHAKLYEQALDMVKSGKDMSNVEIFLCPICGDIEIGVRPEKCPLCSVPDSKFQTIA